MRMIAASNLQLGFVYAGRDKAWQQRDRLIIEAFAALGVTTRAGLSPKAPTRERDPRYGNGCVVRSWESARTYASSASWYRPSAAYAVASVQ